MRDFPPKDDAHIPSPSSPAAYMILQYDSYTGEVVPRTSSIPLRRASPNMQDTVDASPLPQHALNGRHGSHYLQNDAGTDESPLPRRRSGPLGSVVRKFWGNKPERSYASLPSNVQHQPVIPYTRNVRPVGKSHRPMSTSDSLSLPSSPMAAHPLAVADAADTAARVSQFLSKKAEPQQGTSMPDFVSSCSAIPHEETWYETPDVSAASVEDSREADKKTRSSSISSKSIRRRSRSVSALSEITRKRSQPKLRHRKSEKSLSTIQESQKLHRISNEETNFTAYRSVSSGEPFERITATDNTRSSSIKSKVPSLRNKSNGQENLKQADQDEVDQIHEVSIHKDAFEASQQAFDFQTLVRDMSDHEYIDIRAIEEQIQAIFVKQMSLEKALSNIQGRLPAASPTSHRSLTTYELAASEALAHFDTPGASTSKRKKSPSLGLQSTRLTPVQQTGLPKPPSNTSTVFHQSPESDKPQFTSIPGADEPISPNPSPGLSSLENLNGVNTTIPTIEHYSALLALFRQEQTARKDLAEEIDVLREEIAALKLRSHG